MTSAIGLFMVWVMRIGLLVAAAHLCRSHATVKTTTTRVGQLWPPEVESREVIWFGKPVPWLEVVIRSNPTQRVFDWHIQNLNPALVWLMIVLVWTAPRIVWEILLWCWEVLNRSRNREPSVLLDEIAIPSRTRFDNRLPEGLIIGMLLGGITAIAAFWFAIQPTHELSWADYFAVSCLGIVTGAGGGAGFGWLVRRPHIRGWIRFRK